MERGPQHRRQEQKSGSGLIEGPSIVSSPVLAAQGRSWARLCVWPSVTQRNVTFWKYAPSQSAHAPSSHPCPWAFHQWIFCEVQEGSSQVGPI